MERQGDSGNGNAYSECGLSYTESELSTTSFNEPQRAQSSLQKRTGGDKQIREVIDTDLVLKPLPFGLVCRVTDF
jgi:hypothetical protein